MTRPTSSSLFQRQTIVPTKQKILHTLTDHTNQLHHISSQFQHLTDYVHLSHTHTEAVRAECLSFVHELKEWQQKELETYIQDKIQRALANIRNEHQFNQSHNNYDNTNLLSFNSSKYKTIQNIDDYLHRQTQLFRQEMEKNYEKMLQQTIASAVDSAIATTTEAFHKSANTAIQLAVEERWNHKLEKEQQEWKAKFEDSIHHRINGKVQKLNSKFVSHTLSTIETFQKDVDQLKGFIAEIKNNTAQREERTTEIMIWKQSIEDQICEERKRREEFERQCIQQHYQETELRRDYEKEGTLHYNQIENQLNALTNTHEELCNQQTEIANIVNLEISERKQDRGLLAKVAKNCAMIVDEVKQLQFDGREQERAMATMANETMKRMQFWCKEIHSLMTENMTSTDRQLHALKTAFKKSMINAVASEDDGFT